MKLRITMMFNWKLGLLFILASVMFSLIGNYIKSKRCNQIVKEIVENIKSNNLDFGHVNLYAQYLAGESALQFENKKTFWPKLPSSIINN